jgi:uncharacterized protein YdcH (DUF465 family)
MVKSWLDGRPNRPPLQNEVKLPSAPATVPVAGLVRRLHWEEMPGMEQNALEEIKAHLMQTNEKYRHLVAKHHEYDRQVEALEAKHALSADEEIQEHRLKKLKLQLKDEMEQLVSQYRLQHAS